MTQVGADGQREQPHDHENRTMSQAAVGRGRCKLPQATLTMPQERLWTLCSMAHPMVHLVGERVDKTRR